MEPKFKNNIKKYRLLKNISVNKLSEVMGVSRQSINKWERGIQPPSTTNLLLLSEILGVSIDELTATDQSSNDELVFIFEIVS